jgi:phage terminase small subunit
MAGMKGKSGGARPNSGGARPNSGGKRPGAGRKPKQPRADESAKQQMPTTAPASEPTRDPLEFLLDVMQGRVDAKPAQVRAAIAAAQYKHMKKGDGGKKDEAADKAKKAAAGGGKFAPAKPPTLIVNNTRSKGET